MFAFLYFLVIGAAMILALRAACGPCVMGHASTNSAAGAHPGIPVIAFGWAASLFLAATYVVCVGFDLIFPGYAMYAAWIGLMPGMTWLDWAVLGVNVATAGLLLGCIPRKAAT